MSATIQTIQDIVPIEGADSIVAAKVLGWTVVVKKGEFSIGSPVVYVEQDSVVPNNKYFSFLEKYNFRVRTIKLKGVASNGLCVPIDILLRDGETDILTHLYEDGSKGLRVRMLDNGYRPYSIGQDVSEELNIGHYEHPVTLNNGDAAGLRPSWIPKTDEKNLLSSTRKELEAFDGQEVVITEKIDGQSATFFIKNDVFGCCSRTLSVKESGSSVFWSIARKYDIENKMRSLGIDFALQGEVYGPNIQSNRVGVPDIRLAIFNGLSADSSYWNHDQYVSFCKDNDIPTVRVLYRGIYNFTSEQLQAMADKLTYETGNIAEGIVIRPVTERVDLRYGRLSRKVVSNKFKLKYNL